MVHGVETWGRSVSACHYEGQDRDGRCPVQDDLGERPVQFLFPVLSGRVHEVVLEGRDVPMLEQIENLLDEFPVRWPECVAQEHEELGVTLRVEAGLRPLRP
jgi:hypothetical protein